MSLLVFVMPEMFANKKEQLKRMFALFPNTRDSEIRSKYEQDRIQHAKRIMKPFFLRRLKSEVMAHLPKKTEEILKGKNFFFEISNHFSILFFYFSAFDTISTRVLLQNGRRV